MVQSSVVGAEHYNTAVKSSQRYSYKTSDIIAILGGCCLRMTESRWLEPGSLSASCLNRSLWRKSSPVLLVVCEAGRNDQELPNDSVWVNSMLCQSIFYMVGNIDEASPNPLKSKLKASSFLILLPP